MFFSSSFSSYCPVRDSQSDDRCSINQCVRLLRPMPSSRKDTDWIFAFDIFYFICFIYVHMFMKRKWNFSFDTLKWMGFYRLIFIGIGFYKALYDREGLSLIFIFWQSNKMSGNMFFAFCDTLILVIGSADTLDSSY